MREAVPLAKMAREYVCQVCGKTAVAHASRGPVPKCCVDCARKHKNELANLARNNRAALGHERTCRHCKKLWLAKSERAKFCSKECQYLASGGRVLIKCVGCGDTFGHTKAQSGERRYCSRECFASHAWTAERTCPECGNTFRRAPTSKDKAKYCGRPCYFAARKAGRQPWDRTAQNQSAWHRGGRWANPPSRKPVEELRTNLISFLAKVKDAYARALRKAKACEVCGADCRRPQARFCSLQCLSIAEREEPCCKCGKACRVKGVGRKGACDECRRRSRNLARRKYGKHYRSRARYHGVKYVAFPVRDIFERDGYRCQICRKRVFEKARYRKGDGKIHPLSPTIDHIVPMCKGGNHEPSNCQTACFQCNSRKGDSGGWQLRLAISSAPTTGGQARLWPGCGGIPSALGHVDKVETNGP